MIFTCIFIFICLTDNGGQVEPNDTDTEEDPGRNNPRFLFTGTLEGQIPYLGHNFHARWMPAGEHATAEESEGESVSVYFRIAVTLRLILFKGHSPHLSTHKPTNLSVWSFNVGAHSRSDV